ncbi:hypothetical protein [Streptomyces sp. SID13031]|uniref:hypothetical protein n=1 Tax=Streptomyces sp. SID13031 TaxID=2706046 RepID=UPI0013C78DC1|nr:hypothetical protein [Streptomyces sp. SID13031]NEA32288.1 hypothetical protein [Streptomyces sp. SID13031]
MPTVCPDHPIGVLDACVLVPPSLRDVLLSCAHELAFRPVWQDEIFDEVLRNSVRLLKDRSGLTDDAATAASAHMLDQIGQTFPDGLPPPGLAVVQPDRFLLDLLTAAPVQVVNAVEGMSRRLRQPKKTTVELAEQMAKGRYVPGFGDELGRILADGMP